MKIRFPLINKTVGLLGSIGIRAWMDTLHYKAAFYDPLVDPVNPPGGPNLCLLA